MSILDGGRDATDAQDALADHGAEPRKMLRATLGR